MCVPTGWKERKQKLHALCDFISIWMCCITVLFDILKYVNYVNSDISLINTCYCEFNTYTLLNFINNSHACENMHNK